MLWLQRTGGQEIDWMVPLKYEHLFWQSCQPSVLPWIWRAKVGMVQVQGPTHVHLIPQWASTQTFRFGQPGRGLQRCRGSLGFTG